jgi:hypothetical protein
VRLPILLTFSTLLTTSLAAQQPQGAPPSGAAPAPAGPAAQVGLSAQPKWGQSPERQREAEQECYAQTRAKTGIDPAANAAREQQVAADTGTTGIVGGRRLDREAEARAGQLETFRKTMKGCLEASGYTVQ